MPELERSIGCETTPTELAKQFVFAGVVVVVGGIVVGVVVVVGAAVVVVVVVVLVVTFGYTNDETPLAYSFVAAPVALLQTILIVSIFGVQIELLGKIHKVDQFKSECEAPITIS